MTTLPPTGWQTLIIVLPSILAFLTASLAAIIAGRAGSSAGTAVGKIDNLHVMLNSRLDALILATAIAARAEGVIAGAASERAAQADRDAEQSNSRITAAVATDH